MTKSEKDIAKEEKNNAIQEIEDLKAILALPEGKRFVWRLLDFCGLYRNPLSERSEVMGYNCGMQAVAQWLIDECLICNPKATAELLINNKIEQK